MPHTGRPNQWSRALATALFIAAAAVAQVQGAITRSRPLCQYPQVAKYKGSGSTDDAANFTCSSGF